MTGYTDKDALPGDFPEPDDPWTRTVDECNRSRRESGMQERPTCDIRIITDKSQK